MAQWRLRSKTASSSHEPKHKHTHKHNHKHKHKHKHKHQHRWCVFLCALLSLSLSLSDKPVVLLVGNGCAACWVFNEYQQDRMHREDMTLIQEEGGGRGGGWVDQTLESVFRAISTGPPQGALQGAPMLFVPKEPWRVSAHPQPAQMWRRKNGGGGRRRGGVSNVENEGGRKKGGGEGKGKGGGEVLALTMSMTSSIWPCPSFCSNESMSSL